MLVLKSDCDQDTSGNATNYWAKGVTRQGSTNQLYNTPDSKVRWLEQWSVPPKHLVFRNAVSSWVCPAIFTQVCENLPRKTINKYVRPCCCSSWRARKSAPRCICLGVSALAIAKYWKELCVCWSTEIYSRRLLSLWSGGWSSLPSQRSWRCRKGSLTDGVNSIIRQRKATIGWLRNCIFLFALMNLHLMMSLSYCYRCMTKHCPVPTSKPLT